MSPGGWWELVNGAGIEEARQALNAWGPHMFEQSEGHLAQSGALVRFKMVLEYCGKFIRGYVVSLCVF